MMLREGGMGLVGGVVDNDDDGVAVVIGMGGHCNV